MKYLDVLETEVRKEVDGSSTAEPSTLSNACYLKHTGMVWDSIDHLTKELSTTEVEAISKL